MQGRSHLAYCAQFGTLQRERQRETRMGREASNQGGVDNKCYKKVEESDMFAQETGNFRESCDNNWYSRNKLFDGKSDNGMN